MLAEHQFDVVIIGGGPAGASAAQTLAAAGRSVCVIDRSAFPRDKLCGGLLTLRSKRAFESIFQAGWNRVIHGQSNCAKFYFGDRLLNTVSSDKTVYFTCRREYDAYLLGLAQQAGAAVLQRETVAAIDLERNLVCLQSGPRIAYDILIGADGVNSHVARTLFGEAFDRRTIGFGLEVEMPRSINDNGFAPEVYFGVMPWGYGWVFPKRDTFTVGVGGLLRRNADMRPTLQRLVRQRFASPADLPVKGHFIPFGDFRKAPGRDNVLLCGDAAGLVEPITGEGIAFAMLSGSYAAESARDALADKKPALAAELYSRRYEAIASDFRHSNRLRHLLFPSRCQAAFARVLSRSSTIARRHMDLMAGDLSHSDYTRFLLGQLFRSPVRALSALRDHPRATPPSPAA